jgi:hypothetical protein
MPEVILVEVRNEATGRIAIQVIDVDGAPVLKVFGRGPNPNLLVRLGEEAAREVAAALLSVVDA